jgi:hypothetical protein
MYGKKKMMMGGGMVSKMAEGGLTEQQAKRPNPYTGNEPEAKEMEKETSAKMADGGMAKGKPAVMAIVAKLAKKPMSESGKMNEEMEDERGEMEASKEAKMAAAEEVMSALKSGDKEMFAGALENFMRACDYES